MGCAFFIDGNDGTTTGLIIVSRYNCCDVMDYYIVDAAMASTLTTKNNASH
jgi:hypothetical protein